ncbi:MAG: ABC transporter permease subunit [Thermoplasmata archaeon]
MKWSRSLAIIRKELWEFRRQKYIMYSLLFPPIILALVLPFATFLPILTLIPDVDPAIVNQYPIPSTNISLDNHTMPQYLEEHFYNTMSFIEHANLSRVVFSRTNILSSVLENCTVRDYRISGSVLRNCTISTGVIRDSLLINTVVRSTVLINCSGLNVELWDSSVIRSPDLEVVSQDGMNNFAMLKMLIDSYTFLLIMMPAITPTVIASYTFVGEKNNKSLEPLLATRATDSELLWGKILAILLPTMLATVLGFLLFAIVSNAVLGDRMGYAPFPNDVWLLSLLLLSPLMCFLAITANVIISSKLTDVRASQQVGSLVILPILLLFIGSFTGFTALGSSPVMLVAVILVVANVAIFALARRSFRRETILVKWK